jgi:predicted nucleotidyltransferase component of viral defense system
MLTEADLEREAAATGFRPEVLERVIRLLELLEALRSHPFLKTRIALKGGSALNLFVFDVPRLSVDIDVNYIGAPDRESMLAERPKIEQAVQAVCGRQGIGVRRMPRGHAGGKWRLSHTSVTGRSGGLELDINFMLRTPLWPVTTVDSKRFGSFGVTQVPMLDLHELAAGKLAALFGRGASRDLFDVRGLLRSEAIDRGKLRMGFVVYGGFSRRDWRTVSLEEVQADAVRVEREIVPLLPAPVVPSREHIGEWTEQLVGDCRSLVSQVLPFETAEFEFLDRLNTYGEVVPELLTGEEELQTVLRLHPGLRWKAVNVREHRNLDGTGET